MNRDIVINNQYQVTDVLHQDAFQRIYLAQDLYSESKIPVYLTAFKDLDAGQVVIHAFQNYEQEMKQFFDDFFMADDTFYTVSKQCPGQPFPGFITNTILNPYEKGQVVSNYLNKIVAMEPLPMMVKYVLSSFGNISILDRKIVCMNNILFFSPEDMETTHQTHLQRIGDFILCVYGNSLYASLDDVKNGVPPETAAIIQRCYEGSYPDVAAVQKDFNPIFFKSRLKRDERPSIPSHARPSHRVAHHNYDKGDVLAMPGHPDAPERPFLLTRERKVGRRKKRSQRHLTWVIALAAILLFSTGLWGISRLFTRSPEDQVAEGPPAQEEPAETPQVDNEAPLEGESPDDSEELASPEETEGPETPATPPDNSIAPTPGQPYTEYTVQSGDTLYAISQRFLGSGNRYPEIMEYNNITDSTTLMTGQVIRIPNE